MTGAELVMLDGLQAGMEYDFLSEYADWGLGAELVVLVDAC